MVSQGIAILERNHRIVEGSAPVELGQGRVASQLVMAITARFSQGHLVLRPRELNRLADRSVDRPEMERLIHRIRPRSTNEQTIADSRRNIDGRGD